MNRRFLSIFALCLYPFLLQAAPFAKHITFTQPDGTPITLWGRGDEFYAEFETLDGYSVVFDPSAKAYVYARLSADGSTLESSGLQVGQVKPATVNLKKHLKIHSQARKAQTEKRVQQWDSTLRLSERWKARKQKLQDTLLLAAPGTASFSSDGTVIQAPPAMTTTGTKVGLTLLVDFSDDPGTISQSNVVSFCNGTNYTGYGNNGSVKQYFYDNSRGLLTYTNVVTAYIRVPHPKSYYNDTAVDCAIQGRILVTDAINAMKALPTYATTILPLFSGLSVDTWSDIVACNIFFAGSDSGVWDQGLWPNSYALASSLALGNGKSVYSYQITDIGTSLELGTFCHENGHMLCDYPDIYDYDNSSEGGAGVFCLMNSGGNGGNPSQICAYLKRASGWATTIELAASSSLTGMVGSAGTNFNTFYRYAKPGVSTEYFLIENRQQEGRDADQLPGGGLAVWHIDELGDHNNESLVPNSSHANYEVTLVQADSLWHFENNASSGDASDLYYRGNTAAAYSGIFDDYASPAATWWNGSTSGLSLWNISVKATNMTFTIGYPLPRPAAYSVSVAGESALPFNNAIDPGETVSVDFSLRNLGGSPTTNLMATLLPGGGVTAPSGAMSFGALPVGAIPVSRPFMFTATGTCGATSYAVLQLQDGTTSYGRLTNSFTFGAPALTYTQYFDSVAVPALPAGWSTTTTGVGIAWVSSTATRDTLSNSVFASEADDIGLSYLISPAIPITTTSAQLDFRHKYSLESGYDGGVLDISIGGGVWQDILAAGGSFISGGYMDVITSGFGNPLAARQAWSGASISFIGCSVLLPAAASGHTVQFRWGLGTDNSTAQIGWYLDTLSLSIRSCPDAPAAFQAWQFRSFGTITGANTSASADWDHDGFSNTNEFLCGTLATNPASRLNIEGVSFVSSNRYGLTWQCVTGKSYQIAYAGAVAGTWLTNLPASRVTASSGMSMMSYTDTTVTASASNRFYRVQLSP